MLILHSHSIQHFSVDLTHIVQGNVSCIVSDKLLYTIAIYSHHTCVTRLYRVLTSFIFLCLLLIYLLLLFLC